MIEWLQFGLGIIIFIGGCIGVSIRFGYIVSNTVSNIIKETDAKIGRVYERFDSYKEHVENSFVRKESCSLIHSGTTNAIEELKEAVERQTEKIDAILLRLPNKQ